MKYVGITDFASSKDSILTLEFFSEQCQRLGITDRKLMVGVMMSYKTSHNMPSSWAPCWPTTHNIHNIFINHPLAFNTLHYADYDGFTLPRDLYQAVKYGGENLHALQLDMIWPDSKIVDYVKNMYPNLKIVLQVGPQAFEKVRHDPRILGERLRLLYGESVDYVLLDASAGRGKPFLAQDLVPYINAIKNADDRFNIAVAGGLGPGKIVELIKLVAIFGDCLSWDAQGGLRPSGDAHDPIEWPMAFQYIYETLGVVV